MMGRYQVDVASFFKLLFLLSLQKLEYRHQYNSFAGLHLWPFFGNRSLL